MENKNAIIEELFRLRDVLEIEKEEDLRQYTEKMAATSLAERRKSGICWYPVRHQKTTYNVGRQLIVKVVRKETHKDSHLFQSGKIVSLFSNSGDQVEHQNSVHGVVNYVREQEMVITLNCDEEPDWIRKGNMGVQLMFDENSYREMNYALRQVTRADKNRLGYLRDVIYGYRRALFSEREASNEPLLNESQNRAMNRILQSHDIAVIHGPPGTGKTTTLIHTIQKILQEENQVLVCAPSNAAVDLLVEKLDEFNIDALRIGHPARVTEELLKKTMDARISLHKNFKEMKELSKRSEEFRRAGKKYKRNFGQAEREQRKMLLEEARNLKRTSNDLENYIMQDIVSKTRVIATTLIGASSKLLKKLKFETVIIDEAAQGLEPAMWIPLLNANRVVFAGDHCQLPPTVKSYEAGLQGLGVTLFEKAIKNDELGVMLKTQYRMHQDIMNFSSKAFYHNNLRADESVREHLVFNGDKAIEYVDTAGCGYYEEQEPESKSTFNAEEAGFLIRHFNGWISETYENAVSDEIQGIGIISSYKAQVNLLGKMMEEDESIPQEIKKITSINTIDSFQGQERDVIYISLARSNERSEIGFLSDIRRMNVAMTRARKKLVIIGDSGTIGLNEFYASLLDYVNEKDAYRSAFEWLT